MAITRQSLLEEIRAAIDQNAADKMQHSLGYWGASSGTLGQQAKNSFDKINQLKSLLQFTDGGMGESSVNPFSTGSGGGAPTVSTSNRFESGLSDAESRLRSLLDNPDSIRQSAAYKFRVGKGQEALQRSLGARGLLNSGNRLMELTKYGQDMGSQEYDAQAGRLGNLLGNYSQSWIGDKNANTGLFNAQANAWNQAQANQDRTKLAWAEFNKPQYTSVRGSGGGGRSTSPIGSPMGSPMGGSVESSSAWINRPQTVDNRGYFNNMPEAGTWMKTY